MSDVINEIELRCSEAGLDFEERVRGDAEQVLTSWIIKIPKGRNIHEIVVTDEAVADLIACEPFEDYARLNGYEASWSRKHGVIECSLTRGSRAPLTGRVLTSIFRRLGEQIDPDALLGPENRIEFPLNVNNIDSISLGQSSNVHTALMNRVRRPFYMDMDGESEEFEENPEDYFRRVPTIRIEGATVQTHDDAVKLLERIGNSLLFQIDLSLEISLMLARERERFRRRSRLPEALSEPPQIRFEYDSEAMTLYWYAKTATEMPLLQFLAYYQVMVAYYQVMEFYFPTYSRLEAQSVLRNILKDPTFNVMKDADISRLLEAVRVSSGGRAFGDEVSQLEATIMNCVTANDLRDFLSIDENEERYAFYTSDRAKKLVRERVPLKDSSADLRTSAVKRIYTIRCRIVHTKAEHSDVPLLLPFDPETKYLHYDISLAEFLARKVLVASSRPL